MKKILIVDDDSAHRAMLKASLDDDFTVIEADDGDRVLSLLEAHAVDLLILDLKMGRMGGLETLAAMKEAGRYLPVIVLTAFSSVDSAVAAMKEGASDYLTKPVDIDELKLVVDRTLRYERLESENEYLRQRLEHKFNYSGIIGRSRPMRELFETLALVAPSAATVLIRGESGTGKELIANVVHQNSPRKKGLFVKVNCAALHENLLESELFGHEKGAFTGADKKRRGRFEQAHGGTLFLDEIGDMSLTTQAKILRVLQEGECSPLGGDGVIKVDVRLIAATHRALETMVEDGSFRQDLFFRLNVVPVQLPSLRERREDIPLLAKHFMRKYAEKNKKNFRGIHPLAMRALGEYHWPGNIRELENCLERAVILCPGEEITPADLPEHLRPGRGAGTADMSAGGRSLKEMERELIRATLVESGGNRSESARILGVSRQTLLNKIKEYGFGGK